jgi:hypothetical protein
MSDIKNTKFIHILNVVQFVVILILFFALFSWNKNKDDIDNKVIIEKNNNISSNIKGTSIVPPPINTELPDPTKITPVPWTWASLAKTKLPLLEDKKDKVECKTKDVEYTVSWNSMEPMLKNNSKVKVIDNYYKCSPNVSRWDVVIYNWYPWENSLIKRVRALPWDKISVDSKTWELKINWEVLKNSKKEVYKFSVAEITFLKLYINNGLLQNWAYFIFWDNITNSIDSRKFWAVSIEGFSWKVKN